MSILKKSFVIKNNKYGTTFMSFDRGLPASEYLDGRK
jgi:hypothetical protein